MADHLRPESLITMGRNTHELQDNARWTTVTRPIIEAFFHARFFLEMAVRYVGVERPPERLPSGYAALLYLYGLR